MSIVVICIANAAGCNDDFNKNSSYGICLFSFTVLSLNGDHLSSCQGHSRREFEFFVLQKR